MDGRTEMGTVSSTVMSFGTTFSHGAGGPPRVAPEWVPDATVHPLSPERQRADRLHEGLGGQAVCDLVGVMVGGVDPQRFRGVALKSLA